MPTITYTYHAGTKLLHTKTDVKGLVTTVTYGDDLRVRSIDQPESDVETVAPSQIHGLTGLVPVEEVTSRAEIDGEAWTRVIDSLGYVSSETDANGNTTRYVRDGHGRVREIVAPNPDDPNAPLVTKFEYNARGRVTKVTNPDGTDREYTYAANGLDLLSEKDERGEVWVYEVDPVTGNRTQATDPTGRVTRYEYYGPTHASKGLLRKVIQQKGAAPSAADDLVTTFEYDGRGNVTKVINPDGTFRTAVYDQATNTLTSETDERGHTTSYTYDAYGRVKTVTLPDPDGAGPLTAPVWIYVWCACGSLKSVTDPLGGVTAYEYDEVTGLLESTTAPDPDGAGPLGPLVTSYSYDGFGRVLTETAPGNRVTTYGYDGNGNLTSVTLPDPDGVAGAQLAPVWDYEYDALGRLATVVGPDPDQTATGNGPLARPETAYTYDALGRLQTETDPTGLVTTYFYTPDGRPLQVGAAKLGATLAAPGPLTQFTYDDAGRLETVTGPLGHTTTYDYDEFGRTESVTGPPPGDAPGVPTVVVGRGGGAGDLRVLDARTGAERFAFDPDPNASGPARVALGDQTGDGVADVVVSPANSSINNSAVVKIYDGVTGALVRQFIPWANYTAGAFLADSDVAEGEENEIVVASVGDLPGTPHGMVRVFRSDGTLVAQFIPIANYDGVLRLATADVDGDGQSEILVCRADTVSPPVRVFSITYDVGTGAYVATHRHDFTAFPGGAKGAFLAGGDVDGDGRDEVLIGNDSGVQARVAVYDVTLTSATFKLQFTPYGASTSGVRVAAADLDWDGAEEVIVTPVAGTGAEDVRAFDLSGGAAVQVANYAAFTASYAGNVFVAAGYGHGELPAQTTSYAYDALGRVETATDPLGRVTTYDYDAAGNLTSLTDAAGNVTSWVYDALGRVTSETDPLGEVTSYAYDALGNLTRLTDRLGRVTEYAYDALGRLTTETWRDAAGAVVNTVHYAFDAAGRLDLAWDGYSTYDYGYDALGRLLTVDNAGNGMAVPRTLLTSSYDAAGNRTGLSATNPGGTHDFLNTYTYDAAGRMTRVTQQGQAGGRAVAAKRVDLAYDGLGRLDLVSRYADLAGTLAVATSAYGYDAAHRLTSLTHAQGGTTFAGYVWAYDALGRLTKEVGPDGTKSYGYDPTGQLTRAGGPDAEGYGYDATGNRTSGGSVAGTGNRLLEDATYTYDDAGNRTRRTKKADGSYEVYTWDHRNRLKWVAGFTAAGTRQWIVEYRYDLFDDLIARFENTQGWQGQWTKIEKFVYDAAPGKGGLSDVVLVFDGNGNVTNRSLHGPAIDQLFADESAVDGLLWALSDRQGSVRDWAKYDAATGTTSVYNHVEFDAWGRIESQSNAGHRVTTGHAGRYHDPLTGLVWHRGRWRDPKATWLGSDPIGLAGGDPNLYRFVGNSPTNGTDPSGLEVFVASRDFASPLGNHHFIIVVPKNPNDFRGLVSLGGGKRGFTVAGFDTEGRLRPQFNNTDDIAAAMEALGTRRKGRVWDYDCETKRVPRPKGMTDTQFISEILSKVKNYRRNENADPIDYDLGDRNCASWVNALLQELGYPEPTRDDLLEFDGIDWGEEDPLTPNPFMDPVPRRR